MSSPLLGWSSWRSPHPRDEWGGGGGRRFRRFITLIFVGTVTCSATLTLPNHATGFNFKKTRNGLLCGWQRGRRVFVNWSKSHLLRRAPLKWSKKLLLTNFEVNFRDLIWRFERLPNMHITYNFLYQYEYFIQKIRKSNQLLHYNILYIGIYINLLNKILINKIILYNAFLHG